jgi:hypothetical protein
MLRAARVNLVKAKLSSMFKTGLTSQGAPDVTRPSGAYLGVNLAEKSIKLHANDSVLCFVDISLHA